MKKFIILAIVGILTLNYFANIAFAMTAVVNVPEKYSEINAGDKIYFETEIKWPENTGRKDLRIEYHVEDKDGTDLAYLKVLKAIETQASFMDSISIPESTESGLYKLNMIISDYGELDQEISTSFHIKKAKRESFNYILIIMLAFISVISVVLVVELSILIRKNHDN